MKLAWIAALLPLLAGCDSLLPASAVDLTAADDRSCRDYGFVPGTEGYATCRMQLDLEHRETNRGRQQEIRTGLMALGGGLGGRAEGRRASRTCMAYGFRTAC